MTRKVLESLNMLQKNSGRAVIWTPITILGILAAVYFIAVFSPPIIRAYKFKQAFELVLSQAAGRSDQRLMEEIRNRLAYETEIPFKWEDVAITRVGNTVIIDVYYETEVPIPFREPYVMKLNPHVEREIRGPAPEP